MKIGRQIFLAMLGISLSILIIVAGVGIVQLAVIRSAIADIHSEQSELLTETNLEVLTGYNENMVADLAMVYSQKLESKFTPVVNQLLTVRNHLENAYRRGVESVSRYDESDLNLRSDVTFADVEDEFRIIRSVRDVMSDIRESDETAAIYFSSESGMMIESRMVDDSGFDFRVRGWYTGAVEAGDIYWSDVFDDVRSGGMMIAVSVPVFGPQGQLMGVVGYDIVLTRLVDWILNIPTDIFAFTFLYDSEGAYLIGSVPYRDLVYFIDDEQVRNDLNITMRERPEGVGVFSREGIIVGYAVIPTTDWRVGVLIDYLIVNEPIMLIDEAVDDFEVYFNEYLSRSILIAITIFAVIAAVVVIFSIFISRRMTRSITSPIDTLTLGVQKVSEGDLEYTIEVNSGNELETLAKAFNAMTASLREHIELTISIHADNERISTELNVAKQIQASMLPCIFPAFPEMEEFDIFANMIPAKEVGGDFYDFFLIDEDKLAMVIADVSGKGIPAALFMVIAKTLIKNNAQYGKAPGAVFETVNNLLCENNDAGMFVTVFMGVLDIPTGKFHYVNAGHNPPLIKRADGDFEWLATKPGIILAGTDGTTYTQDEIRLSAGDTIFMYTDGVTEAANPENELFTEQRLLELANKYKSSDIRYFLDSIVSEVYLFADGAEQADDLTMLIMKIEKASSDSDSSSDS